MFHKNIARVLVLTLVATLVSTLVATFFISSANSSQVAAADDCQMFNETGFAVCGRFLTYWRENGGLAQQGYPISGVMDEQNQPPPAGDGKIHRVQYFQRARFEEHLENQPPYDVLLGLLGAEQLQARKNPTTVPAQPTPTPVPTTAAPTQAPANQPLIIRSYTFRSISGETPKPGFRFLVIDVVLTNTSASDTSSNILAFDVTTDKLYDYEGDFATFSLEKALNLKTLTPGESVAGQVAFQIPTDETPKVLSFDFYDLKAKVNF